MTWQNFPVAEATAVQEILDSVDEAVNVEFDEVTLAADMYTFLEQLEVNTEPYKHTCYTTPHTRTCSQDTHNTTQM